MHTTGEIDVGYDVLAANQELARENRHCLDECGITAFNIMGAIGSGKTLLIEKTIEWIGKQYGIGVIAGDVVASIDTARFQKYGVPVIG